MRLLLFITGITLFVNQSLLAQHFIEVPGEVFPVPQLEDFWTGAIWLDVDGDKDLDLLLTNRKPGREARANRLFLNNGGVFTPQKEGVLVEDKGYWFGVTSGDYNNDGLTDLYVAGFPGALYQNLGKGHFRKIKEGTIANPTIAGICAGFGDFNNDGNLDLIITRPEWIEGAPWNGPATSPHLMINNGPPNYDFRKIETTDISLPEKDTYMQPTLFDFDEDNDLDVFISMGSGKSKVDLMYKNTFSENEKIGFSRLQQPVIAKTLVEGNQWSFEDMDNDGDWDVFVTNWANVVNGENIPRPNFLFENQNGKFNKIEREGVTTDADMSTTSLWGDFDNDADLDIIVVTDSTYTLKYYQNNGAGKFTSIMAGQLGKTDKHQSGGTVGDYDEDGDLDLFIPGPGEHYSLWKNELKNKNNWVKLKVEGTNSNKSGIGASLWLKAKINGRAVVQRRFVSSSNVFFGQNSLIQHFGIGTAKHIESLVIRWPSGRIELFKDIAINKQHTIIEGAGHQVTNVNTINKN